MPATPVSKEAVRLLAIQFGVREAARRMDLNEDTVCQWSRRFNWFPTSPRDNEIKAVSSVSNPGDVMLAELQRLERETKLSLAKSAQRMAQEATEAKLNDSGHVHNVAKTAAIVHRWDAKEQASANVVVNVALLGIDPATVAVQTLDVESECQGSG